VAGSGRGGDTARSGRGGGEEGAGVGGAGGSKKRGASSSGGGGSKDGGDQGGSGAGERGVSDEKGAVIGRRQPEQLVLPTVHETDLAGEDEVLTVQVCQIVSLPLRVRRGDESICGAVFSACTCLDWSETFIHGERGEGYVQRVQGLGEGDVQRV